MIKFTKLAALCSLIALPTHALARDVNDLGVDVQAATSAYIVKNSNKRYPGSYNGSRLEGWALMSYVVDTQGKAKDIEVIIASDTRGSEENAEKYLTNLEFAPATKEGKTVEGGYLFSFEVGKYFNGYSNDKASRGFINEYDEINKMLQAKEFDKAEQALAELYKDHTKNTSEQALFAWLKSQYYYHQQQWFGFDEQLSVAYLLRAKLPTDIQYLVAKSALQWYSFKGDFNLAYNAIYALDNIEGKQFSEENKLATIKQIDDLLARTPQINSQINVSKDKLSYLSLSRGSIKIEGASDVSKLQIRCADQVIDLEASESVNYVIDEQSRRCGLLVKSASPAEIKVKQTGYAIVNSKYDAS